MVTYGNLKSLVKQYMESQNIPDTEEQSMEAWILWMEATMLEELSDEGE